MKKYLFILLFFSVIFHNDYVFSAASLMEDMENGEYTKIHSQVKGRRGHIFLENPRNFVAVIASNGMQVAHNFYDNLPPDRQQNFCRLTKAYVVHMDQTTLNRGQLGFDEWKRERRSLQFARIAWGLSEITQRSEHVGQEVDALLAPLIDSAPLSVQPGATSANRDVGPSWPINVGEPRSASTIRTAARHQPSETSEVTIQDGEENDVEGASTTDPSRSLAPNEMFHKGMTDIFGPQNSIEAVNALKKMLDLDPNKKIIRLVFAQYYLGTLARHSLNLKVKSWGMMQLGAAAEHQHKEAQLSIIRIVRPDLLIEKGTNQLKWSEACRCWALWNSPRTMKECIGCGGDEQDPGKWWHCSCGLLGCSTRWPPRELFGHILDVTRRGCFVGAGAAAVVSLAAAAVGYVVSVPALTLAGAAGAAASAGIIAKTRDKTSGADDGVDIEFEPGQA